MKEEQIAVELYQGIKNKIISGELQEEDKISERNICEIFSVSRSIVRNVINHLRNEGWLYVRAKSGTYVAPIDLKKAQDVFDMRLMIEPNMIAICLPHLTEDDVDQLVKNCNLIKKAAEAMNETENGLSPVFHERELDNHRILRQRCDNSILIRILKDLEDYYKRLAQRSPMSRERRLKSVEEWENIVSAIQKKDAFLASNYMAQHILNFSSEFWKHV